MNRVPRIVQRPRGVVGGDWPEEILPLLRRLYATRGAADVRSARPRLADLPPPDGLCGIDAATALLAGAIAADRHILVVGDFDCDGATACAVAVRGLRMLGARRVSFAVPDRFRHGYGLSVGLVEDLAARDHGALGAPQLLVTVDHGIACHQGIATARALGWQVLVTDHHLPGASLPDADAIVNPNQPGDGFPGKALAGVGVAFYVLLALRARLRAAGTLSTGVPDLSVLLDLVAVGTVADLVPLDPINRSLVAAGLRRLRAGQGLPGLRALAAVASRDESRLGSTDIGFTIAPRINAAGRLEDMALGIECLLCDDPARARQLAAVLDGINAERRVLQQTMVEEAERLVALRREALAGEVPAVLCLFDPDWHPGVIGLVASKLKEALHRPVIAFAPAGEGCDELRGSARSIPGFHIRDALAAVDTASPGLIARFGGHAMAAGLTLPRTALASFESAFRAHAENRLDATTLRAEILSDGELHDAEFDRAHAEALRDAGPWGQGFPEPLFDGVFEVAGWKIVGERHLKLSLRHPGRDEVLGAIHFGGWGGEPPTALVHIAYRLQPDDYRGGDAVQLVVVHREPA